MAPCLDPSTPIGTGDTVLVIRREFGARWMWCDIGYQVSLAWLAAFAIHQGGRSLGLG